MSRTLRLIRSYPRLVVEDQDYEQYWEERSGSALKKSPNSFQKYRADWILPRMESGSSILDIGSGDGVVLSYLNSKKELDITASDISDRALEVLQERGLRTARFDATRLEDIKHLPDVDHIVMFEVLEHMRNPEQFLKVIEREKKARKSLFFSFPNTGYFAYRIRMLMGRCPMQWRVHPGEHVRYWTMQDLRWWLKQLDYYDRTTIGLYEGMPVLNKLWGSMFAMGFVGEIKCGSLM